jgi:hypothetical protein
LSSPPSAGFLLYRRRAAKRHDRPGNDDKRDGQQTA